MSEEQVTGSARALVAASFLDLSLGGAQLRLPAPFEVGTEHDFSLDVDGHPLVVHAVVRYCRPDSSAPGAFDVGVAFAGVAPVDEQLLREYLSRQA